MIWRNRRGQTAARGPPRLRNHYQRSRPRSATYKRPLEDEGANRGTSQGLVELVLPTGSFWHDARNPEVPSRHSTDAWRVIPFGRCSDSGRAGCIHKPLERGRRPRSADLGAALSASPPPCWRRPEETLSLPLPLRRPSDRRGQSLVASSLTNANEPSLAQRVGTDAAGPSSQISCRSAS